MLIGVDYSELHPSLKEIQSHPGERGWKCIEGATVTQNSYFARTYSTDKLDILTERFWKID